MIPISSRIEKYEKLYNEKMQRYNGHFDGIRFGYVNGKKILFLKVCSSGFNTLPQHHWNCFNIPSCKMSFINNANDSTKVYATLGIEDVKFCD